MSDPNPSTSPTGYGIVPEPPIAPATGGVAAPPPVVPPVQAPPILPADAPPPLRKGPGFLTSLLSLFLVLFAFDAGFSFFSETLGWWFNFHFLSPLSNLVSLVLLLFSLVIYVLMAFTPAIPKRIFLWLSLFAPLAGLVMLPVAIYYYTRLPVFVWCVTGFQLVLAIACLFWAIGGGYTGWPLVGEERLGPRRFSGANLLKFLVLNLVVFLPLLVIYLLVCASLAVSHFSEGFVHLHPGGLSVQVRKYQRADGRIIDLVPMSHIGESEFYQSLSKSFPSNAVILREGVTDHQHLLTNGISYHNLAKSLGIAEQQNVFHPTSEMVSADIDVSEFSKDTIGFLNLTMLIHSKGFDPAVLQKLQGFQPPEHFDEQIMDDVLHLRNRHLLKEIESQLKDSTHLIIPWGAAHMPEISHELEKRGFKIVERQEFQAIRFGSHKTKPAAAKP